MLALRRRRMAASPAFLRGGFRPFFLLGSLWAVLALSLWLGTLSGVVQLPTAMDSLSWHRHEMLFGFVGAVIAGFLLTAIPNWTGRLPIAGTPLALLVGLWVAGRAAMLMSGLTGPAVAGLIDTAFLLVLAVIAGREVFAARNRNLPVVGITLVLAAASALDHLAMTQRLADPSIGIRLAMALITILLALIGGRIIPSFTRNWLVKRGVTVNLPVQPNGFDMIAIGATALALLSWVFLPESVATAAMLLTGGLLQLVRLGRWSGHRTLADPLVLILHIGYVWVPAGLLLLGASILAPDVVPSSAAVHALTAGAMTIMILAVMTRATLGHTGRTLAADTATCFAYLLVTTGAMMRVAAPLVAPYYTELMRASALFWAGAFILFLVRYGPMLVQPRTGGSA